MNIVSIAVSVAVGCGALVGLASWFRSRQATDLGSVSTTWIAELRAGEPYDSSR
jgi:hypothetical protein